MVSHLGHFLLLLPLGRMLIQNRVLITNKVFISLLKNNNIMCQTKPWYLFQGINNTRKKCACCPWILPGQNNQPSNLWKILRQPHYFEKTVYSHGHNSWETEPMTNICVMKLCISNLRKMKHGRSQFTCNLTLPPLKQNRGT